MSFVVETCTIAGRPTAVGAAGPYTLVVDRPAQAGGGGLGFNGGQLLYLAVAGCVSNDLFREADAAGISLHLVGYVDRVAEIPNSLRGGTEVRLDATSVAPAVA